MPVAIEQATQRGVEHLRDEVEVLAVHGLLHLIGYRDDTDERSAAMLETEERLLGRQYSAVVKVIQGAEAWF